MPLKIRSSYRYKPRERRVIECVTRPVLPPKLPFGVPDTPCNKRIYNVDQEELKENMYEKYLIRKLSDMFLNKDFIVFCSFTNNPTISYHDMARKFKKYDGSFLYYDNNLLTKVIEQNKQHNLKPYLYGENYILFSDINKSEQILKIMRNTGDLVFHCIYSKQIIYGIEETKNLMHNTDRNFYMTKILQVLTRGSQNLVRTLQSNQKSLVQVLNFKKIPE
ncbi:MAG: YmL10 [Marteilia pararefringens]